MPVFIFNSHNLRGRAGFVYIPPNALQSNNYEAKTHPKTRLLYLLRLLEVINIIHGFTWTIYCLSYQKSEYTTEISAAHPSSLKQLSFLNIDAAQHWRAKLWATKHSNIAFP